MWASILNISLSPLFQALGSAVAESSFVWQKVKPACKFVVTTADKGKKTKPSILYWYMTICIINVIMSYFCSSLILYLLTSWKFSSAWQSGHIDRLQLPCYLLADLLPNANVTQVRKHWFIKGQILWKLTVPVFSNNNNVFLSCQWTPRKKENLILHLFRLLHFSESMSYSTPVWCHKEHLRPHPG